MLTYKAQTTTTADDILNFSFLFSEKIRLDMSCELSAWQMIHMKCLIFSEKQQNQFNNVVCYELNSALTVKA